MQQFCLQPRVHFPNLVQQNRSLVAELEFARLRSDGPGKSSRFIAKQLAFQQLRRQRCAIDLQKSAVGARGHFVNQSGHQFFARPGLAQQQHWHIGVGDLGGLQANLVHRRTGGHKGQVLTSLDFLKGTLRMIADHLWTGVGIGNFTFAYVPYRSAFNYRNPGIRPEHPHNEYLNLWAELGPLGLLVLLWLAVRIVQLGWHVTKGGEGQRGVLAGVLGGIVASAAYANLFYVVHVPASAVNLAILLGMLDGMSREVGYEERGKPIRLTYLLPGLLVMYLLSFQYFVRPLAGEIYYFLAETEFSEKRVEAGLSQLERSLEWNPQSFRAGYRRLSVLFNKMGRYPETIEAAEAALKIHPNMELAYDVMGKAYLNLGDKEKAKEVLLKAAALNVNFPHALNSLGVLAALDGRIREAEILFVRAKEILGRSEMSVYANLGNVYEMTGRIREALRMYETAVAITPKFGSNWYTVARLRVLSGDPGGAYAPLARAIALDDGWRARATEDAVFEDLRQGDPRVRILLRLE